MATIVGPRKKELDELETIRFVTSALFEVSAEKIDNLRSSFELNASFYEEIGKLYGYVKQAVHTHGQLPEKSHDLSQKISVAFTSNSRFYGSVNTDVMNLFIKNMQDTKSDYMIIGRMGEYFMRNFSDLSSRVSFLSFEGDDPTMEEVHAFLKKVSAYDQVYVYHSTFVNIFTQKISVLDIAHASEPDSSEHKKGSADYIFEPELPKILAFFETRVRYLLFQRIMLESELARTAARLIAMNKAQDRADNALATLRRILKRDSATFNDARLLEAFSAISKWKK